MKPTNYRATVEFKGFDNDELRKSGLPPLGERIRECIETHPVASFRIDSVTVEEAVAPAAIWSNEDPRHTIWKHATVIISNGTHAFGATVETKHGWYILVEGMMNGRNAVHDNDDWPPEWWWVRLPKVDNEGENS